MAFGEKLPPDASQRAGFSDYITDGRVIFEDVLRTLYDRVNKAHGRTEKPPL